VKYEDHVIDEAGLILVMEYLPLGNLMQLNQSQKLSKEEARTCLRQILQALKYLHSLFITHRDIKPANILILYREPELFVKVTDFGLSKEGCFLSSHCGTAAYVAAEVYTGYYTNSVDIWSTGVVALELIEGLPRKESDHTAWSKKVRRAVDRLNRRANDPLSQILEKMLQLDPNDRMSAEDCLREPWVQKNGPSWRSSGIIEQATEIIEPAPEVEMTGGIDRHLEESSFDDEAPTQIWNPPVGAVGDERLPPTQRGDCTEDENGDEWLRPVQREKVYEEEEADEGEEVISATRKVTRRQLKRPHDETPDMESTPTQQKRVSREQFHPKNLTENRLGYVQMTVNGKPVSMRKSDYWLNATQLLVLAGKKENERKTILDALKKETTVQVQTAAKGFGHATSWVCYVDGRSLCDTLHVTDLLSALLEYPPEETKIEAQKAGRSKFPIDKFIEVSTGTGSSTVSIRRVDFWTNASNILKEAGQNKVATRSKLSNIRSRGIVIDVIRAGQKHQGSYIEFSEGLKLCDEYSLSSLKEVLQKTKGSLTVQRIGRHRQEENPQTWNRPVNDIRGDKAYQIEQEPNQQVDEDEKADEREDDECGLAAPTTPSTPIQRRRSSLQAYFQNEKDQSQSQYITIRTGTNFNIVSIRRADLWINATDILREAGVYTNRTRIFSAMRKAGVQMEHKRGSMARGMYMPYQEGLNLCTKHELAPLKVLLQRTKEGLAFKTTGDPGLEGDHERDGAYDEGANEDEGDEDEGGEDEEADEVEGVDADEEAEFTEISYGIRLDGNSAELHVAAAVSETSGSVPIAHGSRSSFLAKGNLSNSSFVSQSSVSGSDSNCVTYGIGPLGFDSSWIEELIR
jgi:serine/threonine protein kinase